MSALREGSRVWVQTPMSPGPWLAEVERIHDNGTATVRCVQGASTPWSMKAGDVLNVTLTRLTLAEDTG